MKNAYKTEKQKKEYALSLKKSPAKNPLPAAEPKGEMIAGEDLRSKRR